MEGAQHNRRFTFDSVFDERSTQEEVFHYSGIKRLVDMAIEGYVNLKYIFRNTIIYFVDMLQLVLHMVKQAVEKHILWLVQEVLLLYVLFFL